MGTLLRWGPPFDITNDDRVIGRDRRVEGVARQWFTQQRKFGPDRLAGRRVPVHHVPPLGERFDEQKPAPGVGRRRGRRDRAGRGRLGFGAGVTDLDPEPAVTEDEPHLEVPPRPGLREPVAADARSPMSTSELTWFQSSCSSGGDGDCVEVALAPARVHVRDSKDRDGGDFAVSAGSWAEFLSYVSEGWTPQRLRSSGTPSTPGGRRC
ncbi:DUF397 domain-containing protein [Streptomyces sp. NPDC014006]|uniref:DUF397 domain-containing protein n=1 Tax=Streptomyces sp. NPDC014006 TaxID=3364870 RepID=UPI0036FBD215